MRIIAGRLRRRAIKAPKGHLTRPTTDRTRESVFNLIGSRIDFEDIQVLDLFAGTGSLGLEAISRGANLVYFVEENGRVMKVCRENATTLEVDDACVFYQTDTASFLRTYSGPAFDIVFADPPYELPDIPKLPDAVRPHVKPDGFFVLEHDQQHNFEEHEDLIRTKEYGRTIVSIFQYPGPENA